MFPDLLLARLNGIVELSGEQVRLLEAHYQLLLRWNRVINLTAVHKPADAVERHYCESLFLGAHLPPGAYSIGDIGSGAGFPGIPVAVLRPECQVALIESDRRKAAFLREATRDYGNVQVIRERAEASGGTFDWVVSRAVNLKDVPVAALAGKVAFLGGEEAPEAAGVTWESPVRLPWGEHRLLWVGRCAT